MIIKIDLASKYKVGGAEPDQYEYDTDSVMVRPKPSFIMTRDASGKVASYYRDNSWQYDAYSMATQTILNFEGNIPHKYIDDAKWLVFILDRVIGIGKNNNNLSVGSLSSYLMGLIKPLCFYAENEQISIFDVMSSKQHTAMLVKLNMGKSKFVINFIPFIKMFNSIREDKLGFVINIDSVVITKVKKAQLEAENNIKQTPIIPPRLYGNYINQAWDAITEYEEVEKKILNIMNLRAIKSLGKRKGKEQDKAIKSCLEDASISDLMFRRGLVTQVGFDVRAITRYLNCVRHACKDLIHIYSGMRYNEALNLPDRCYRKDPIKKRKNARLLGHTFKYTGYKSPGNWVTTYEIERVIKILNSQNEILFKSAINKNFVKRDEISELSQEPWPLFISTRYLNKRCTRAKSEQLTISKLMTSLPQREGNGKYNCLYNSEQFKITEQDLVFLQRFEPERDWELEGICVGEIWNFTSHQFRRSLAVYSRQSGLVSIGSVQTQLHHLFIETSYYYANNAENCTFDVTDKDHMSKEFAKNTATADFAAYIFDIMFSEEPLHGVQGKIEERTMRQVKDKETWIKENRKETEKKFSKGLLAHSDTPLGSCSSTEWCNEKLIRNIVGCIGCKQASLKLSKIERTIEIQVVFIESLSTDSVEYRSEKEDLEELIALRNRVA